MSKKNVASRVGARSGTKAQTKRDCQRKTRGAAARARKTVRA